MEGGRLQGRLGVIWTLQGEENGRAQEVCGDNAYGTLEENVAFLRTKIRGELLKS